MSGWLLRLALRLALVWTLLLLLIPAAGRWWPGLGTLVYSADEVSRFNFNLYALDVARGLRLRLAVGMPGACCPAWSPDGRELAFVAAVDSLPGVFVGPPGGPARRVSGREMSDFQPPHWSPDGRIIAFLTTPFVQAATGHILQFAALADLNAGTVRRINGLSAFKPAWSADNRLALTLNGPGIQAELYTTGGDARLKRLTTSSAEDHSAAWSPDGARLAYISDGALVVAAGDGSGARRLTATASRESTPIWTPDGRAIIYAACSEYRVCGLYRADAVTGAARRLTAGTVPDFQTPAWSPDGARLAFMSYDGRYGIFLLDETGTLRRLTPLTVNAMWPVWWP